MKRFVSFSELLSESAVSDGLDKGSIAQALILYQ